ncbi:phosphatidate cytidylyltransferase [Chamaesiphon sp. OTE_75_metabat_556]|uniref:phosphatidate cytidylyltransferase n=1 Tax=Chamaesiphon sp. OTE_75_metabat_556 TaxID=2964692 RepID=UPI0037BF6896
MMWNLPADNVLWCLGAIGSLLVIATLSVYVVPAFKQIELQQRLTSWCWIVALFAITLIANRSIALCLYWFLSFLAFKEYISLIPTRLSDRRVLFWAYLAIVIQYYWISIHWYVMFLIFVPVYTFLFLPMRMVIAGETQGFLKAIGTLHWGLMLTVFSLGHLAYLLMLPDRGNPIAGSAGLVLYLVFLTEINDIAQYIWGKSLGRHPVTPTVSPNKTWEGLIGGILTTTSLAIAIAPWLTPFDWIHALGVGLIISCAGFIGDVTISALKRDLGVKDSGNIIPGHGGILDRIDSLTYTAPLFFHFTVYFYFRGMLV